MVYSVLPTSSTASPSRRTRTSRSIILMSRHTRYSIRMAAIWQSSMPTSSLARASTKPTAEKPALLTLGEVETFLHEFGHSLHGMFANTRFESLSGTNVWWDFVELPSQFMENYAVEKDFLRTFAFHYKTGEQLHDGLCLPAPGKFRIAGYGILYQEGCLHRRYHPI